LALVPLTTGTWMSSVSTVGSQAEGGDILARDARGMSAGAIGVAEPAQPNLNARPAPITHSAPKPVVPEPPVSRRANVKDSAGPDAHRDRRDGAVPERRSRPERPKTHRPTPAHPHQAETTVPAGPPVAARSIPGVPSVLGSRSVPPSAASGSDLPATSGAGVPSVGAPGASDVPDAGMPDTTTPVKGTSGESAPDNSGPDNSAPDNSTPGTGTRGGGLPDTGISGAPSVATQGQATPAVGGPAAGVPSGARTAALPSGGLQGQPGPAVSSPNSITDPNQVTSPGTGQQNPALVQNQPAAAPTQLTPQVPSQSSPVQSPVPGQLPAQIPSRSPAQGATAAAPGPVVLLPQQLAGDSPPDPATPAGSLGSTSSSDRPDPTTRHLRSSLVGERTTASTRTPRPSDGAPVTRST
jgi:hypothetical protein